MIDRSVICGVVDDMFTRMRKLECYSQDTINSNWSRLCGGTPSPIDLIVELPVNNLAEIRFREGEIVRDRIKQICVGKSVETLTGKNAVTRKFFGYLMKNKLIEEDLDLLRLFKQKHDSYKIPQTLSPREREIMHTEDFSSDPFLHLRATVIFVVLGEGNAMRMEVEPERTKIVDIIDGFNGMTLIITGKGGKRRPIRITYTDAVLVRQYLEERQAILAFFDAEYEQALFIKKSPEIDPETGKLSFGLSRSGIYGIFQRFRSKHPELSSVKPYTFRKDAITRMLLVARALGIPFEEVGVRNGNTIDVIFAHYAGNFDLYSECLRRTPEELIPFLNGLWAYCMLEYYKNPCHREHKACAEAIMLSLGQLQFIMLLQGISSGRIQIPERLFQNGQLFQLLQMNQIAGLPLNVNQNCGLSSPSNISNGNWEPLKIAY